MNVLITGGSSGLGKAIVERLAQEPGMFVYFTYARSATAATALETAHSNTRAIQCDFADTTSVDALLQQIPGLEINVLINNANTAIHKEHFQKTDPAVFQTSFATNIIPTLRITQEVLKVCRKKKFGKIINIISSAVINKPPVGWSDYAACKAYLLSMSKSWATENIRFNITSNAISPAFMLTPLTADTDERMIEQMTDSHPLKQLLTPEEVTESVIFLIRSSQQINGNHIIINAGNDMM